MELLDKAIIFAVNAHSGATRKGGKKPYILHPLEAAAIAASITDDENVIVAAVLHDVIEDTAFTSEDLKKEFGEVVLSYVLADTEDKRENLPPEETWKIRKQETIEFAKNKANYGQKTVMLSDKLSNLRSINRDYKMLGEVFWQRFHIKEKSQHAWYYKSFLDVFDEFKGTQAYDEYSYLLKDTFD